MRRTGWCWRTGNTRTHSFEEMSDTAGAINLQVGQHRLYTLIGIIWTIATQICATKCKNLHSTPTPLRIQGNPEFTTTGLSLGQINHHQANGETRDGIEDFNRCTSGVNLIARLHKLT